MNRTEQTLEKIMAIFNECDNLQSTEMGGVLLGLTNVWICNHFPPDSNRRSAQERRDHLEAQIRNLNLDLKSRTEQKGRPYTLVCTKTTESYQAKLKEYQRNKKRLEGIRSIEADLP